MKRNLGFETEFLVSTRVGVKYIKWYISKYFGNIRSTSTSTISNST